MADILSLPASLRLMAFVFYTVASAILLFCIVYGIMTRRSKLSVAYLFGLFACLVIKAVTETPLIANQNLTVATYVHFVLLLPFALALTIGIKNKKYIAFADAIWCVFNLPFWTFIPSYGYLSIGSFAYILMRLVFIFKDTLIDLSKYPGRLSIKYALDDAEDGIAFVNLFGRLTYVNSMLGKILERLGISYYKSAKKIVEAIEEKAKAKGRIIDSGSYVVFIDEQAFRFAVEQPLTQITCVDVSEEEGLLKETEANKVLLKTANEDLARALKSIEKIQKERELLAVKGRIHDDLAQRLSILHMFILNDDPTDLTMIKDMLSSLEIAGRDTPSLSFIEELKSTLSSIGVTLEVEGEIPPSEKLLAFCYKLLKEATTNAVKHGKSRLVKAKFESQDDLFKAEVQDDGLPPKSLHFGNGLSGLLAEANALGGTVYVSFDIPFTLHAEIPLDIPQT